MTGESNSELTRLYMKTTVLIILVMLISVGKAAENESVIIRTTAGDMTLLLDAEKAPVTVANFLSYVDGDGYTGSVFHRVIEGFMIQTGGLREDMSMLDTSAPIRNEADNGLRNVVGSIAMARLNEIDSASRQFFINVNDNVFLDNTDASCTREDEEKQRAAREKGLFRPATCKSFGYAVFGRVTKGMDIVRKIEKVAVGNKMGHQNVPIETISIIKIERVKPT